MKIKLLILIAVFILTTSTVSHAQQTNPWSKWSWMIGEWRGSGSGEPGSGTGSFSFKPDLTNKILVRKAHSVYPAAKGKPEMVHDDLMIVYLDAGEPSRAIYFDNEGHTINYSITYGENGIVMLSDKVPNSPVFRLTYTRLDDKTANVKFEMSQDGKTFMTYIEGKCTKTK